MKRNVYFGLFLVFSLVLLGGCRQAMAAKDAAEAFVNGAIYDKDPKKLETAFGIETKSVKEETETHFINEMKDSLGLDGSYDERLQQLFATIEENIANQTSYTANVLKEEKGKAEVELVIIGLAEVDEEQLDASLGVELEKVMKEVTAETTEAEMTKMTNEVSLATLESLATERKASTESTKVTMTLMVDSADKSKWVIQNQDSFIIDLLEAFGQ